MCRVAIVQTAPAMLDKDAGIRKAVTRLEAAANQGAVLVVFSETFLPGYPAWVWRLRPGADWQLSEALYQRLTTQAIDLATDDLLPLCEAARRLQLTVVLGVVERDPDYGRTTLYNTVVIIGPDGSMLNRHRKLMPTNPERMVWGLGDASGLRVVETAAGRLGSLICWENYMPLARYALYAQGMQVHIAPTYDTGEGWLGTLQHIAREGRCWVLGCGHLLRGRDLPEDLPGREQLYPDPEEWINPGDSVVIEPGGRVAAGPLHEEDGLLIHDIDPAQTAVARRALDVTGHYARPDIFQLRVHRAALPPVAFDEGGVSRPIPSATPPLD